MWSHSDGTSWKSSWVKLYLLILSRDITRSGDNLHELGCGVGCYDFCYQKARWFQRCLVVREYCKLFTHESNTFLGKQYVILPTQTNGDANAEKSPKKIPLETRGPQSNTWMPRLTPLTTPNGIWIKSAVLPQYTLWTQRQTDRQTDTQRMFRTVSTSLVIVIESDVLLILTAFNFWQYRGPLFFSPTLTLSGIILYTALPRQWFYRPKVNHLRRCFIDVECLYSLLLGVVQHWSHYKTQNITFRLWNEPGTFFQQLLRVTESRMADRFDSFWSMVIF